MHTHARVLVVVKRRHRHRRSTLVCVCWCNTLVCVCWCKVHVDEGPCCSPTPTAGVLFGVCAALRNSLVTCLTHLHAVRAKQGSSTSQQTVVSNCQPQGKVNTDKRMLMLNSPSPLTRPSHASTPTSNTTHTQTDTHKHLT